MRSGARDDSGHQCEDEHADRERAFRLHRRCREFESLITHHYICMQHQALARIAYIAAHCLHTCPLRLRCTSAALLLHLAFFFAARHVAFHGDIVEERRRPCASRAAGNPMPASRCWHSDANILMPRLPWRRRLCAFRRAGAGRRRSRLITRRI